MQVNDAFGDSKSKASAAVSLGAGLFDPVELVEYQIQLFFWNCPAIICNKDLSTGIPFYK